VAREGIDLAEGSTDPGTLARVAEEMDRMLERFLAWAGLLVAALREDGHWGNAVDPRCWEHHTSARPAIYIYVLIHAFCPCYDPAARPVLRLSPWHCCCLGN
jgi:hypothetical protein